MIVASFQLLGTAAWLQMTDIISCKSLCRQLPPCTRSSEEIPSGPGAFRGFSPFSSYFGLFAKLVEYQDLYELGKMVVHSAQSDQLACGHLVEH